MNRAALTCGLAAMDVCSLYPWLVLVGLWTGTAAGVPLLSAGTGLVLLLTAAFPTPGIGRLVAFGLVMAVTSRPSALPAVEAETTPYIVGFFFVSLLTLALGRLESLRTRTRNLSINTQWFGVLVLIAGLVVLLALLLGQ